MKEITSLSEAKEEAMKLYSYFFFLYIEAVYPKDGAYYTAALKVKEFADSIRVPDKELA